MEKLVRCTCADVANCRRPHGYIPPQEVPPITRERAELYAKADVAWVALQIKGGGRPVPSTHPTSDWYRWREATEFSKTFSLLTAPFNEYHS